MISCQNGLFGIVAIVLPIFLSAFSLRNTKQFKSYTYSLRSKSSSVLPGISSSFSSSLQSSLKQEQSIDIPKESWAFLDAVYLITTYQSSPERLQQTRSVLEDVNLWDRVNIRKFQADNEDRVRGCYTSHIAVLKEIQKELLSKNKSKPYRILILEDNLEMTRGMSVNVLSSIQQFLSQPDFTWDIFHLAYMMYVPGLNLLQLNRFELQSNIPNKDVIQERLREASWSSNILQMKAEKSASVGTSAYIISRSGVEKLLQRDATKGYTEAIPNIMAEIFPDSRYAAYPMVFHRAGKVSSLVNPQLDDFRRIMFNPIMYTLWERLMVSTGLQNNQLFPTITISLFLTALTVIIRSIQNTFLAAPSVENLATIANDSNANVLGNVGILLQVGLVAFPLAVALWGASLFKPGNTGRGFATTTATSAAGASGSSSTTAEK